MIIVTKHVRFTLRIHPRLYSQIEVLARRNNMSNNRFIGYLLDIGLNDYLKRFEKF